MVVVPALSGLGAPHWRPEARAAITGLSFSATRAHVVRAALEAISHQTQDLAAAFAADGAAWTSLRIDGGMSSNDWLAQDLADLLQVPVVRPDFVETTALGAAMLAAVGAGLHASLEDAAAAMIGSSEQFAPAMDSEMRADAAGQLAGGAGEALAGTHFGAEPIAQAVDCAGVHCEAVTPGGIEPADARVEPFGAMNQCDQVGSEHGQLLRVRRRLARGQAPVMSQLELAQLAGEIGPLVEQPGNGMHHSRGRAQRLARKRDAGKIVVHARRGRDGPTGRTPRAPRRRATVPRHRAIR